MADQVAGKLDVPVSKCISEEFAAANLKGEADKPESTDATFLGSDCPSQWFEQKQKYQELSVFKEPQCLISEDETGKLKVNEEITKEMAMIEVPMSVVAITGPYRTGKSYLMNRLFGKPKGFSIGKTVHSHTKGIWVWCNLHPRIDQRILVFLDTEGLANVQKGHNDSRIFSLAVLMSSTLIYNSKDVLNADDIQKLTLVAHLSEDIQAFSGEELNKVVNENILSLVSPLFISCLRDAYLEIDTTEDEYFENCLSTSKAVEISQCIRRFFPKRKCFMINQPAMGADLRELENLDETKLTKSFVDDELRMREFIYKCEPKYIVPDRPADGQAFTMLLNTYVNTLKKGTSLNVEEALENVSRQRNQKVTDSVLKWLRNEVNRIKLPISRKEHLLNKFFQIQEDMLRKYRKNAYPLYNDNFESQLKDQMEVLWEELRVNNSECIKKECEGRLAKLNKKMMKEDSYYKKEDMSDRFEEDLHELESKFYEEMKSYDMDEFVGPLADFKASKGKLKHELTRQEKERALIKQKEMFENMWRENMKEFKQQNERDAKKLVQHFKEQTDVNMELMTSTMNVVIDKSKKARCSLS